jgi:hypothetical protein
MTHANYHRVPFHLRHAVASAVPHTLSARLAEDDVRTWLESNPAPKLTLPDAYQVEGER